MMRNKKIKVLITAIMVTGLMIGTEASKFINKITNVNTIVYAQSLGLQTETGIISKNVKYEDNLKANASLQEMLSISETVTNETNPDMFIYSKTNDYYGFNLEKMNLTGKIYHAEYIIKHQLGQTKQDVFIKVLGMDNNDVEGGIIRNYTMVTYIEGNFSGIERNSVYKTLDFNAYNYMKNETSSPVIETPETPVTPPVTETPETPVTKLPYTSIRLGGSDRYSTSLEIAKEYSNKKLDNVVITSATDFPDALSGSVLASKYNAPILLVSKNKSNNTSTLEYIRDNLKIDGKVYILGGDGVVGNDVIDSLRGMGFTNFERLGGANRYETNLQILNKLSVSKGTDIVIANSMVFADSLSVSSVASIKGMPILLVNNTLDTNTLKAINGIAPKNVYIVGGEGAVSKDIENKLKGISNVVRLGGSDRYETSLEIAKYFKLNTDTVAVANGLTFPDALSGSVLASKNNANILLINNNTTKQKEYLDSTNISKIYVLGGTGVVNDSIVLNLKK